MQPLSSARARNPAARIRTVRARHLISRLGGVAAIAVLLLGLLAGAALAQQIEITPKTSITPSSHVTTWVFQMAIATAVLGALILIAFGLGYLRFAPKFYGREEQPAAVPPGARPPTLARQAAALRWTPPPATAGHAAPAAATAPASTATATAVAERPAPSTTPAAAAVASSTPAAGPGEESVVQADAVGAAEAEAPEPPPSARTPEETGAAPAAPAAQATTAPAPAAASHGAAAVLDQETFDRVLGEQLAKGVDRQVAEGRARAAAVVAARKKSQG